jgi:hypothetical protein
VLYVFFLLASIELYFFSMQRSCIEISRNAEINQRQARLMIPLWYSIVWPIKISKYYVAYLIYQNLGIWYALGCLAIPLVISTFMPISHGYFIKIFSKKIKKNDGIIKPLEYIQLSEALNSAQNAINSNKNA